MSGLLLRKNAIIKSPAIIRKLYETRDIMPGIAVPNPGSGFLIPTVTPGTWDATSPGSYIFYVPYYNWITVSVWGGGGGGGAGASSGYGGLITAQYGWASWFGYPSSFAEWLYAYGGSGGYNGYGSFMPGVSGGSAIHGGGAAPTIQNGYGSGYSEYWGGNGGYNYYSPSTGGTGGNYSGNAPFATAGSGYGGGGGGGGGIYAAQAGGSGGGGGGFIEKSWFAVGDTKSNPILPVNLAVAVTVGTIALGSQASDYAYGQGANGSGGRVRVTWG